MINLRNKIGQMLIMGFKGTEIYSHSEVAHWLLKDGLGGVLLFNQDLDTGLYGKNLKSRTQIRQLTHQLNLYANESSQNEHLPLFIAIDYEGGAIDRLSQVDECMLTQKAEDLASLSGDAFIEEINQMAATLKDLGFNLNFAPVVDLNLNQQEGIIGALGRSFSAEPKEVISLASQFVDVFSEYGIACSYKHFPGHGSAIGDTHQGFVDVTDTYKPEELIPYSLLAQDKHRPTMIMTAHVVNKHLDSEGLPATLSHEILTGLLRQQMGYDGVIVSDDLQMQAISHHFSVEKALSLTINAGADMLIFGNQLGSNSATDLIDCIEQLVLDEQISLERIDEAYRRIVRLKQQIERP